MSLLRCSSVSGMITAQYDEMTMSDSYFRGHHEANFAHTWTFTVRVRIIFRVVFCENIDGIVVCVLDV